jgi:hypothetical protein
MNKSPNRSDVCLDPARSQLPRQLAQGKWSRANALAVHLRLAFRRDARQRWLRPLSRTLPGARALLPNGPPPRRAFSCRIDIDFAVVIRRAQKWGAEITVYGYARVSTVGQTLAAQDAAPSAAGAAKVYAEKVSGASTNGRKALAQVLRTLREGDTRIVTRLDRLARSTRDLLNCSIKSPRRAPASNRRIPGPT